MYQFAFALLPGLLGPAATPAEPDHVIAFEWRRRLMLVHMHANLAQSSRPMTFLMDTGSPANLIAGKVLSRLGVPATTDGTLELTSDGAAWPTEYVVLPELDRAFADLSGFVGEPVDGVLGMAFFQHLMFGVDFDAKVIALWTRSGADPSSAAAFWFWHSYCPLVGGSSARWMTPGGTLVIPQPGNSAISVLAPPVAPPVMTRLAVSEMGVLASQMKWGDEVLDCVLDTGSTANFVPRGEREPGGEARVAGFFRPKGWSHGSLFPAVPRNLSVGGVGLGRTAAVLNPNLPFAIVGPDSLRMLKLFVAVPAGVMFAAPRRNAKISHLSNLVRGGS